MALISCSECQQQISDKAAACPHCGNPINMPAPPTIALGNEKLPVVTEQTGKYYKTVQIIGMLLVLGGFVACTNDNPTLTLPLLVIGVLVWIMGRIGAWWHHG